MKTGWPSNLAFVKCTMGEVYWCVKFFFFPVALHSGVT